MPAHVVLIVGAAGCDRVRFFCYEASRGREGREVVSHERFVGALGAEQAMSTVLGLLGVAGGGVGRVGPCAR